MTCGFSHPGLGHLGMGGVDVIVSPPDWYSTTPIKSHYLFLPSSQFFVLEGKMRGTEPVHPSSVFSDDELSDDLSGGGLGTRSAIAFLLASRHASLKAW